MGQESVETLLAEARALMPLRKRGANTTLYDALVVAMRACELCLSNIEQDIRLGEMIAALPRGDRKRRQYVERGSDIYQRVGRYVFFGDENNANINRYAITLRQAAKQGVTSKTLRERLAQGGVNQFYLKRPLVREVVSTRCIRLNKNITHRKDSMFELKLRRLEDNSYEIVDYTVLDS